MGTHEEIVGSISCNGGSSATILPLLGFILVWYRQNGIMKRKDWIYILLLLFIGFVSMKRAVWIITPLFIFLFAIYVQGKRLKLKYFLTALPLLPFIFYFGVRLNPSLNKENKIWGTFDLNYSYNYAMNYTFGSTNENEMGHGRGGATLLVFNKIMSTNQKSLFGNGLSEMYATDYETFEASYTDINSKGAASGFYQTFFTMGLSGTVTFILFFFISTLSIRNARTRFVFILLIFWDYFFYSNSLIRTPSTGFLLAYLIIYSNYQIPNIVRTMKQSYTYNRNYINSQII